MLNNLKEFDSVFNEAEVRDPGNYEPLPDGKYQVNIEECFFEQSKTTGRPQFKWVYRVVSGQHAGRLIFHYRGLDTPEGVKFFKQELHSSGFNTNGVLLSDLFMAPRALEDIMDNVLEVTLKTKKAQNGNEYQNLYINRRIEKEDFSAGMNDPDDLPF